MTCGVCGARCEVERHHFFEGVFGERHVRDWFIDAPLYFKATDDGLGCAVPFCGAACAARGLGEG